MLRSSLMGGMLLLAACVLPAACGGEDGASGDDASTSGSLGAAGSSSSGGSSGTLTSSSGGSSGTLTSSSGGSSGTLTNSSGGSSGTLTSSSGGSSSSGGESDAGSDSGEPASDLPGAACSGSLTDQGLLALYTDKPITGTPTAVWSGGTYAQARTLGPYTSAVYKRRCVSTTGCEGWEPASQPNYEDFISINDTVRRGSLYLWSASGEHRFGIVSDMVGDTCRGWTAGYGAVEREGQSSTLTLALEVDDNCVAGADPVFYFEQKDLYDPVGVVTDHCMKLTYSKQFNRVDVGPDAYTYDEYMVVYDAAY